MNPAPKPTEPTSPDPAPADLPSALVRRPSRWSVAWLIPLAAVAISAWLMVHALGQRGVPIHIGLQEGHGLKPGDALRYRGIDVGTVREVRLVDDLTSVRVQVLLERSARDLARAGSRFWVVRPQVDISGASGLKTIIGANYLSVIPGRGPIQRRFTGLEEPPPMAVMDAGGLEILLSTSNKSGLRAGAPVSYRQIRIGKVLSVDLAKDAGSVRARVYIQPEYTSLIRTRTRFWKIGGARLQAGLGGFSLNVESLGALLLGGVTMALPPNPGQTVPQGHRFTLHDAPEKDWLDWLPFMALDEGSVELDESRPRPLAVALHWRYRNYLYLTREGRRQGWGLAIEAGLLAPADLLAPPGDALPEGAGLAIGGEPVDAAEVRPFAPGLAVLATPLDAARWPPSRRRLADRPEDLLVIADPQRPVRFVSARHVQERDGQWVIDEQVPFDAGWHGASVVSDRDGQLVGLLLVAGQGNRVARFLPSPEAERHHADGSSPADPSQPDPTPRPPWWRRVLGMTEPTSR